MPSFGMWGLNVVGGRVGEGGQNGNEYKEGV